MPLPPADLPHRHHLTVQGDGPVNLLFVHGYGCDQSMWRLLAPGFAKQARVVQMDLLGFGHSDFDAYDPARYDRLEAHAQDVAAVARHIADRPTVLVGHSVAAMLGVLAQQQAPGAIAAHVMVAPSPCYLNDGDYRGGFGRGDLDGLLAALDANIEGWAADFAPLIMGAEHDPAHIGELQRSFCRNHPQAARQFAQATFTADLRLQLPHVPQPVLLLQCTDDLIAPVGVGQFMQRQLPDARLVMVANRGHCPHVTAPGACRAAITEFLATCGFAAPLPLAA